MSHWLERIGKNPDGDTLTSLLAKLGDPTSDLWTILGYEGATALHSKLTAARAGYLDQLDFALQEAIAAIPTTMVGTNNAALAASWTAALATALGNYTAVRAGYLNELDFALQEAIAAIPTTMVGTNNAALAVDLEDAMQKATGPAYNQDTDSLEALRELLDTIVTSIAALQTDLDTPAQYQADLTTLETRLSAARAGNLDQLDFALQEAIAAIPTTMVGTNNAALASVLGALTNAAAAGAVTNADTAMAYLKQVVTFQRLLTEVADGVGVFPASVANDSLFAKLLAKGDPAAVSSFNNTTDSLEALRDRIDALNTADQVDLDAIIADLANGSDGLGALKALIDAIPTTMVGTNNAALASAWTAGLATVLGNYTAVRAGYLDQLDFNLQEAIAAIPTTMVGTNNAALASVLEDAMQKATGPAYNQDTDSLEALRELLDTIAGYLTPEVADILTDTGTTLPALLATIQTDLDNPAQYMANLTTLETRLSAVRAGYLDQLDFDLQAAIAAIPTTMVGTNNAALASAWTAGLATALGSYTAARAVNLDELGAANLPSDIDEILALVDSAETDSSYSYLDAGGEQDVYEDAVTTRRRITFTMDINTMTQGGVVKVYLKVDGANYRVWILEDVDSIASGGTEDVYNIEVITNQHFKVSYTEDINEGAARSIPFSVVIQVIE